MAASLAVTWLLTCSLYVFTVCLASLELTTSPSPSPKAGVTRASFCPLALAGSYTVKAALCQDLDSAPTAEPLTSVSWSQSGRQIWGHLTPRHTPCPRFTFHDALGGFPSS